NLISACANCQGGLSLLWSEYHRNCTSILNPSTFPNPVPAGTRVPQWALQDTSRYSIWSSGSARLIGDVPEIFPGVLINTPPISTTSSSSPTFVPAPTSPSFTSSASGLYNGAFAGGVIFRITAIAAIVGLLLSLFSGLL
ncbi:hypothetical protein H4582DRAFT_2105407, partial [Lactarius indigo]